MSFKREGNDSGLLATLRRRRVKELFAEEIAEDEAKLLCNGRFACLVCVHNPVFDTVNMLAVHRQGKKHAAAEVNFLRKKKELEKLILSRKHEQYVKNGSTNIRQATPSSSGGITSSQAYDPRTKKHNLKPYDRKPRLDLQQSITTDGSQSQHKKTSTAAHKMLTAFTLKPGEPMKHGHQLKNIFSSNPKPTLPVQPYRSQRRPGHEPTVSDPSSVSHHPSETSYRQPETSGVACTSTGSSRTFQTTGCASPVAGRTGLPQTAACFTAGRGGRLARSSTSTDDGGGRTQCGDNSSQAGSSGDKREETRLALKYRHLQGSGWKRDWDGKWIRDEDAEFDSDEEPPDLP